MKATKKQIAEVTEIANEMGLNIESVLTSLADCSKGIYDVIGARGFVETVKEVAQKASLQKAGHFHLSACDILMATEKAYQVSLKQDLSNKKFWVAKSLVVEGYFPSWVAKK